MVDDLIHTIKSITDLPEEEENKLVAISSEKFMAKGGLFIREGQIPNKFAFVTQGLFRYYYVDDKGNEFTKGFFSEKSFITAYSAMAKGIGSYYSIEALEDASIIVIDYTAWKILFNNHPCWSYFLLSLLEKGYIKKEKREREFLLLNAEERYKSFLQEYPGFDKRIKQHLIASYLGITPVALSRVRKKMGLVNLG